MRALAEALAARPQPRTNAFDDFEQDDNGDDEHFHHACLDEIDRYRRMDEWIPSYHNVLSTTALDCKRLLAKAGAIETKLPEFIQYTADGTAAYLRLNAFKNILTLGAFKNEAIIRWFFFVLSTDPSPYIRRNLLQILNHVLGAIALGESLEPVQIHDAQADGLVIEQESTTEARQVDLARKQSVAGALMALKAELASNETLKKALWDAITSPTISLHQMGDLLDICDLLYDPETKLLVALKYPRYWVCTKVGKGRIQFQKSDQIRTRQIPKIQPPLLSAPSGSTPLQASSPFKRENSGGNGMPPPKAPKLIFKTKVAPSANLGPSTLVLASSESSRDGGEKKPKLKLSFGKLKTSSA